MVWTPMIFLAFHSLGMLPSILGWSPHPCRFVLRLELSLIALGLLVCLFLILPSPNRLAIDIRLLLGTNQGLDLCL